MSSGQTPSRLITTTLTGTSIKILQQDNITKITLLVTTGPVLLTGNYLFLNTNAGGPPIISTPVSLPTGTVFTQCSSGPEAPIDNITIDATGGVCDLVMVS